MTKVKQQPKAKGKKTSYRGDSVQTGFNNAKNKGRCTGSGSLYTPSGWMK